MTKSKYSKYTAKIQLLFQMSLLGHTFFEETFYFAFNVFSMFIFDEHQVFFEHNILQYEKSSLILQRSLIMNST